MLQIEYITLSTMPQVKKKMLCLKMYMLKSRKNIKTGKVLQKIKGVKQHNIIKWGAINFMCLTA